MKRLYWDIVTFNNQRMFLTATQRGLNFISNPGRGISQVYDFYRGQKFEFRYSNVVTARYRDAVNRYLNSGHLVPGVKLDLSGIGTQEDHRVWQQVCRIPYGEVRTLRQVAKAARVSSKLAARALRLNPILVLIPTHRVIVNAERLGRFRESLKMKSQLLEMEIIISDTGD